MHSKTTIFWFTISLRDLWVEMWLCIGSSGWINVASVLDS